MPNRRLTNRVRLAALLLLVCGTGRPAEFDLDAQRIILRQLQFCLDCGAALLVTRVHPGDMVRCPECAREQPRLADTFLLTQIYQACSLCQNPLDPAGHQPGEVVECAVCHTRQVLSRDIFIPAEYQSGKGFMPGFPPGSSKKHLLHSPERADAAITPVPLDEPEAPPADTAGFARLPIPPPPVELEPQAPSDPAAPATPTPAPASTRPDTTTATTPAHAVPAVSIDMFGGRPAPDAGSAKSFTPSGDMVARVDGTPIFASEIDRVAEPVLARLRHQFATAKPEEMEAREKELRREILERLIDRHLVIKEAARLGHRPDPAAVRQREAELTRLLGPGAVDVKREAERDVIMADMRRAHGERAGAVSPEAVREFYRRHVDQLQQPRLLALSQLVIFQDRVGRADPRNHQEIAAEVAAALERGDRFDDLRLRYDELTAAAGFPLPDPTPLPDSAYSAEVLRSAGSLRKGAVFGPILMEGLALFGKVVEERPAGPIPFEEVEKEIRLRLENEATEKRFEDWLEQLRLRGVVEFYLEGQP